MVYDRLLPLNGYIAQALLKFAVLSMPLECELAQGIKGDLLHACKWISILEDRKTICELTQRQ